MKLAATTGTGGWTGWTGRTCAMVPPELCSSSLQQHRKYFRGAAGAAPCERAWVCAPLPVLLLPFSSHPLHLQPSTVRPKAWSIEVTPCTYTVLGWVVWKHAWGRSRAAAPHPTCPSQANHVRGRRRCEHTRAAWTRPPPKGYQTEPWEIPLDACLS